MSMRMMSFCVNPIRDVITDYLPFEWVRVTVLGSNVIKTCFILLISTDTVSDIVSVSFITAVHVKEPHSC